MSSVLTLEVLNLYVSLCCGFIACGQKVGVYPTAHQLPNLCVVHLEFLNLKLQTITNQHQKSMTQMNDMHKTQQRMLEELQRIALTTLVEVKDNPKEEDQKELFAKTGNEGGGFNSFL